VIADGLADTSVTEVIVDPSGAVWYDRLYGSLERQRGRDLPSRQVTRIITGIAGMLNKSIRDGILEGELLLDGSRIAAWLPPVCPAPSIAIRKHRKQGVDGWPALTLDDYALSPLYRQALYMMAEERRNVLIVGSTGSGKSTFAGAFLNAITTIFPSDRIVTIEDTSELYCQAESWLALHATPTISQRMLLKTAMRARPDRLILGEVRDEAAIDMIMGLTTGHAGFSTIHGASCLHGLTRTLQLTRLNGENTVSPEMISDAIDYVVLMRRRPNGPREVADIQKVVGWCDNRYHLEAITVEHLPALRGT
jgi:Flp pilus assembly CpaF family ATPase